MTETKRQQAAPGLELLTKVAEVESEPTGLDTFACYVWQAKLEFADRVVLTLTQDDRLIRIPQAPIDDPTHEAEE